MNVMLPSSKRTLLPLFAGAALVALVAGLWIAGRSAPSVTGASMDAPPPVEIPEAVIEQVPWKVTAFPAGASEKLAKKQKAYLAKTEVSAGEAVTQIVDALLFEPKALGSLTGRAATAGTVRALARSKLIPKGIEDIKIIRRVANIGIDVAGMRRGAAKVVTGYTASLDGKPVRMMLIANLWLERSREGWKAVAFDGKSMPYKAPAKDKKKSKGKKS